VELYNFVLAFFSITNSKIIDQLHILSAQIMLKYFYSIKLLFLLQTVCFCSNVLNFFLFYCKQFAFPCFHRSRWELRGKCTNEFMRMEELRNVKSRFASFFEKLNVDLRLWGKNLKYNKLCYSADNKIFTLYLLTYRYVIIIFIITLFLLL
jgi:hypothetical protein